MITVTTSAAAHIEKAIKNRGKGLGLRVGTRGSGCSGLSYIVEFCDSVTADDTVFVSSNIQIIVDSKSLVFLDGTEIDYVKKGLNEGFEFGNPNARSECGCGSSFSV